MRFSAVSTRRESSSRLTAGSQFASSQYAMESATPCRMASRSSVSAASRSTSAAPTASSGRISASGRTSWARVAAGRSRERSQARFIGSVPLLAAGRHGLVQAQQAAAVAERVDGLVAARGLGAERRMVALLQRLRAVEQHLDLALDGADLAQRGIDDAVQRLDGELHPQAGAEPHAGLGIALEALEPLHAALRRLEDAAEHLHLL